MHLGSQSQNNLKMMSIKRGQSTIPVAVLIIVMLVFILIYIISLPPEDRERLLNISSEDKGNGDFTGETIRVTVEADEFSFDPDRITVEKGDKLIITFKNEGDISHNFGIPSFGVRTDTIGPGEEDTITFVANKRGTFTFFCSVQGHKEAGMEGELEVE